MYSCQKHQGQKTPQIQPQQKQPVRLQQRQSGQRLKHILCADFFLLNCTTGKSNGFNGFGTYLWETKTCGKSTC